MTKQELLSKFLKNNKERRNKVAQKLGYTDAEAYINSLKGSKRVTKSKPTIHNVYILDKSSSMRENNKIKYAIDGINKEIEALKKDKTANYTQTIVDFSYANEIRIFCYKVPISTVGKYNVTPDGMTALYQAIGQTLEKLKKDNNKDEKVLVKIFTDGEHNQYYGKYSQASEVSALIKECEKEGFTITFVGTEFDTNTVIDALHISQSNTMVHNNTAESVSLAFMCSTSSTMEYSKKVAKGEDVSRGFYSKQVGKL